MGYAFLYGVFGSLLGSNIGAYMYASMIEPALHTDALRSRTMIFWLLFAVLDVVAASGLILFFRKFGNDTADTRRRAARAMTLVYSLIVLLGLLFLFVGILAQPVQYRTVVQAIIFLALGLGGLFFNRQKAERVAQAAG
jgi:hypothetical protein